MTRSGEAWLARWRRYVGGQAGVTNQKLCLIRGDVIMGTVKAHHRPSWPK